MNRSHLGQRALRMTAITLCASALLACASPPPVEGQSAPSTGATTETTPESGSVAATAAQGKQAETSSVLPELRKEFVAAGLSVSDTPEGHLKIIIPGESSFGSSRSSVGPKFARMLNGIANTLNKRPTTAIEIVGHTDSTGNDVVNLEVSKKRAESARNYLIGRRVAAERIKAAGWGSDQPIADNNTAQGRATNRRVEIFVSER